MRYALFAVLLFSLALFAEDGEEMGGDMGGDMGDEMGMGDDRSPKGTVDFKTDILPILQDRCFECHSDAKRKPKGRLRVDSKSFLLAGGVSGPSIVPGRPDRSPLYTRCVLPEDHDDVMPPSGDVLPKAQVTLLRTWIKEGAHFGGWTGKGGEAKHAIKTTKVDASKTRGRLRIYQVLDAKASKAPGGALKQAQEAGARIAPVLPNGKLLRVEFVDNPGSIDDKTVAALAPLRKHIAILSLGRTSITDAVMAEVVKMPNLVRLDLPRTEITDKGLRALGQGKQPQLRRINLYGTDVSDAGLDTLVTLPALAEVFAWDTNVTSAGVKRLTTMRRAVRVHFERRMPEPKPAGNNQNNRRRR
ncbi:MAG: c-type cytochrome domain-containing protein [Planctomycetota bacterium]